MLRAPKMDSTCALILHLKSTSIVLNNDELPVNENGKTKQSTQNILDGLVSKENESNVN